MPYRKFGKHDVFYNRVKAHPQCDFVIYDSLVYFNDFKNIDDREGENGNLLGVPQGFISLYELNVDRPFNTGAGEPPSGTSIYPFITKDGARIAFKTISTSIFDTAAQFDHGDIIKDKYPLSSSIKRTWFSATTSPIQTVQHDEIAGSYSKVQGNRKYILALKNVLNSYTNHSHHYSYNSEAMPHTDKIINWDKSKDEFSLLEVPSIFYGSQIEKGSVILQFFITGVLAAECRDIKRNGELIQVSGTYNTTTNKDKVAGVVLYNEGFLLMTGSWSLNGTFTDKYVGTNQLTPSWKYFGVGANDGTARSNTVNTMYKMSFRGVNYVPTITMLAHMEKGELNNSTNPTNTVLSEIQESVVVSGSTRFMEHDKPVRFHQLQHTDYSDPSGSYDKQVYVSKVGIYDDQRRLLGVATLANPIRKTEERDYTFKLKVDF